jgi:hypothetical protein
MFNFPEDVKDVDYCEGCKHLRYESDTDCQVCTAKGGCVNPPEYED